MACFFLRGQQFLSKESSVVPLSGGGSIKPQKTAPACFAPLQNHRLTYGAAVRVVVVVALADFCCGVVWFRLPRTVIPSSQSDFLVIQEAEVENR